jgi:hypothetical protein
MLFGPKKSVRMLPSFQRHHKLKVERPMRAAGVGKARGKAARWALGAPGIQGLLLCVE